MDQKESSMAVKAKSKTPYQLDLTQTTKASDVVSKLIIDYKKSQNGKDTKPNLLSDGDDEVMDTPIWLILTTKTHAVDKKRMKPGKISLPHSIHTSPTTTICLITADPSQLYTSTLADASFPADLRTRITRTITLTKLKSHYKSFESRRQLAAEHDLFLADTRIITALPGLLGKTFYKTGAKRPIPVNIAGPPRRGEDGKRLKRKTPESSLLTKRKNPGDAEKEGTGVAAPEAVAREIKRALDSALVHLSPSATTSVKVGRAAFAPEMTAANVEAVVEGLTSRFITGGWRNVRAVHLKGPETMSVPVWLAEELWVNADENEGVDGGDVKAVKDEEPAKRKADVIGKPDAAKYAKKKRKTEEKRAKLAADVTEAKARLKRQKAELTAEAM